MLKFHKMYLDAGGRVTAGGNTNVSKAVGLDLHQELEVFVEGGFTPMEAIQAATKWPAETFHWQDRVGTIEAGKWADMIILNADPLQDIHNTQKIDNIVFKGKLIDRKYHPWPSDPFMDIGNYSWGNPAVESLDWVVALKNLNKHNELGAGGRSRGSAEPGDLSSSCHRDNFPDACHRGRSHHHARHQGLRLRASHAGLLQRPLCAL